MLWVYLSPHPDDVALSCGGLVWQQVQAGEKVEIWTICAGDPPPGSLSPFAEGLHARWAADQETGGQETGGQETAGQNAYARRRAEDLASCERLGATAHHFSLPECIYRTDGHGMHLYASEESLFGAIHPSEEQQIQALAKELRRSMPPRASLVCPMTVGGHVDHRLVRAVAERLGRRLWYYPDLPYSSTKLDQLARLRDPSWKNSLFRLSEQAVRAWAEGFAAHASQVSTFWKDFDNLLAFFQGYTEMVGGVRLFRQPPRRRKAQG